MEKAMLRDLIKGCLRDEKNIRKNYIKPLALYQDIQIKDRKITQRVQAPELNGEVILWLKTL
ncbi:MAG: hypothetical protein JWQ54_5005 [Mucilaginibacter sp.]|nr:hypothetical protein [Mucilaginibacter sp.]